jgi:hypothetical protein
MTDVKLDSGILQYVPKGAYYEGTDQQFATVKDVWDRLLNYDRALFSLLTLLNGSAFSKGMITHLLLSNPELGNGMVTKDNPTPLVPAGLPDDFEKSIILFNLEKISEESMPRALKNLLILAGSDSNARKVNNSRTRSIILDFIFNRDNRQLDALAVNYKSKLAKLVRHAIGKQDLFNILYHDQDKKLYKKLIGRYNRNAFPILCFLFGSPQASAQAHQAQAYFPLVESYCALKETAIAGNVAVFKKHMKKLPWRTVMGFRNTYKLPIEKSEILGASKMSDRDLMQTQTAQKRAGAKTVRKVDYKKQELYDLWKLYYHKILNNDGTDLNKIVQALDYVDAEMGAKQQKIEFCDVAVVIYMSHTMR